MSQFTVSDNYLSALSPVKFVYDFSETYDFKGKYEPISWNFYCYKHEGFENFKDAAISKKSALILTDTKKLQNILDSKLVSYSVGRFMGGSMLLSMNGRFITTKNNLLYRGNPCNNQSDAVLITVSLSNNGLAELVVGTKLIEIDPEYPFTAKLVDPETFGDAKYRQFEVEVGGNKVSFKILTPVGYRFLAFGIDNVLRAVGTELNNTIVNNYHFEATFKTRTSLDVGFDLLKGEMSEVKYYNNSVEQGNNETVNVKSKYNRDTHYLVECPTTTIALSTAASANLINLKTNYSSSGSFIPSIL